MEYRKTIKLKDGRDCFLRSASEEDAQAVLDLILLTRGQTDYLLSYPDENRMTAEQEALFLKNRAESDNEVMILAEVDGVLAGSTGIGAVGPREKIKHRAEFGICVDRAYWGLGIGRALTLACIECAGAAGYAQLELDVVADNKKALDLYKSVGFVEYGRNPRGFRSRISGWQELVMMRLELS